MTNANQVAVEVVTKSLVEVDPFQVVRLEHRLHPANVTYGRSRRRGGKGAMTAHEIYQFCGEFAARINLKN